MDTLTPLNPMEVYERGLRDPDSLTQSERLVYVLMELETYADMEGWDHFFATDKLRYYPELKAGLVASGDLESLEVLEDYEGYLASQGVPLQADAIDDFICSESAADLANCRDWREDYSRLGPERWEKVKAHLRRGGLAMAVTRHCTGPARRNGPRDSKTGLRRAGE